MRDPLHLVPMMILVTLVTVGTAAARPFEVSTFGIDPAAEVVHPEVAVGADGTMVFAWQAGATIASRHFTQAGVALGPAVAIGTGSTPRLAADTRGGYVVAWRSEGQDGSGAGVVSGACRERSDEL